MTYHVHFTLHAFDDLSQIDASIARRIADKIQWLAEHFDHINVRGCAQRPTGACCLAWQRVGGCFGHLAGVCRIPREIAALLAAEYRTHSALRVWISAGYVLLAGAQVIERVLRPPRHAWRARHGCLIGTALQRLRQR